MTVFHISRTRESLDIYTAIIYPNTNFHYYAVPPGFRDSAIAENSAEFTDLRTSADFVQMVGKSAFLASFSFLKHQNISIIKKVMAI
jgi:hypothetical protein